MLSIVTENPGSFDALDLMNELSARLAEITGSSGQSSFDPNDVRTANACFVVARNQQGRAVGCGGFRSLDSGIAEIKHMYSRPGTSGVGTSPCNVLSHASVT